MQSDTLVTFPADDGYVLAGALFRASSNLRPREVVVVNAGAGIPAVYYTRFAQWLAASGTPVLCYDYRGIGRSRPPNSLRGFQASVDEWGSKDCAGALKFAAGSCPGVPIIVLGHSVGCFLTGFVRDASPVRAMVMIGPHTGYFGDYAASHRRRMRVLWHVLMPAITRAFGYFPGRTLGLPEDLPAGVALQWAQRKHPDFWWNLQLPGGAPDTERQRELQERFAAFAGSALAVVLSDDKFATSDGAARIESLYAGLRFERHPIDVASIGPAPIGHFGFFRSKVGPKLWPIVSDWIRALDLRTGAAD